jgi:hypothetical protein
LEHYEVVRDAISWLQQRPDFNQPQAGLVGWELSETTPRTPASRTI